MSNQVITIKWSIAELGQYCSNVSAYVASTMAQDGNTFDIFVMTEDNNVTFLKENVSAAILALTPFFNRITPDNFEPINNDVEVGLSFVPRIEGGEYSRTELAYVDSLCKRYIANYILNAWYAQHNTDGLVAYFANSNLVVARDLKDALVRFIRPVRSATSSIRKVSYNYQQPQTTYKHINNRSDFALLWRAKDNLPLPEFNYDLIFFTDGKNAYTVNSESLYFKPIKNEDDKVMGARIIFDFSRQDAEFFNNGVLKYKMYGQVPDADFPDGFRSFEMEDSTDVEIWDKASDTDVDMVTTYIPSYVKLTFDDLTEEDIQQLQTPALQAKAEWDGVKPTINKAISDATAAIEGATTATKSATASATNANAAATQARSQGNGAEERGKNAAKAADDANNRMVEINTEFSNKMDEVDSKVATAEAQFATAISEINDAITNGERAVESIRGALTEVDNKIGEADTAISGANKAKDDANTAKNTANAAAEAANGVANDFLQEENQRVSNEEKRVDAETLREGAEILRAEAERNRAAIESGRVAAESARVNAENARENKATKAISDMQKATTDAINEMKSTTNTTIGNVNKVVSDAVTSADSATDRANTAANEAEEAAASANAAKESIQEELGAKADKTGEYKELTAGFAYEILGDGQATAEQFSFRPTGGPNRNVRDGSARIEVLKGNSVVWNQLVDADTTSVTLTANHKYITNIGGTISLQSPTSATTINVEGGVDKVTDLTQMFGAGNEPATVEKFYELLPEVEDINAYNVGEIVDANYKAIKTTGFNQWDEQWEEGQLSSSSGDFVAGGNKIISKNFIPVIPNTSYFITLPLPQDDSHGVYYYDTNKQFIRYQWLPEGTNKYQFTTPSNCAFIKLDSWGTTYNNDICVNIAWDEYSALNGQYKPYKPFERDLSWLAKYFPNGRMRRAGNVADEIRFNSTTQQWEAAQKVGVRAYQSGDEADTTVTTDGKNTNYALATPDVKTITEDVNLAYDVADYGTEQLIVAEGAQSAPLSAEVVYEPNVLASIKQVAAMLTRLDALETAVATMQASAVATTNEE